MENFSRTKHSVVNFIVSFCFQILCLIFRFITRMFFIKYLGNECLGVNDLFTNILSVLSLIELGLSDVINICLYKPLVTNKINKCKKLMNFLRKFYIRVAFLILIFGLFLIPFFKYLIKDYGEVDKIFLIYLLFLLNNFFVYFFSYRRSIILADQNRYIISIRVYTFYLIQNILQIICLVSFRSFIGYLIIQLIFNLLTEISIYIKAGSDYSFLNKIKGCNLSKVEKYELMKNTKAMFIHKVCNSLIGATDYIMISIFLGLAFVGVYANYALVLMALSVLYDQIYYSMMASVGNLCVVSSLSKQYDVFKKIDLLTFWIYAFSSVCLINLLNDFINIWIGDSYLLSNYVMAVLVINFYLNGLQRSVLLFRDAKKLFYKDRYKGIIEALLNLFVSVILVVKLGIFGVILGTLFSFVITFWYEPFVVYRYGFSKSCGDYFITYFKRTVFVIVMNVFVYFLCSFVEGNLYIRFLIKSIYCIVFSNLVLFVFCYREKEFKFFLDLIKRILSKRSS